MGKVREAGPEIREDLHGRIEVFDQSIRSFEKRLRAVERRLSVETPGKLQPGGSFPNSFSDSFMKGDAGDSIASSSVSPECPSVSPEDSLTLSEGSLLSDEGSSLSETGVSNLSFSALLSSADVSEGPFIFVNTSSEVSSGADKVKEINALFAGFSESLRSLQEAIIGLSDFVHGELGAELEAVGREIKEASEREVAARESAERLEQRLEAVESQNRFTLGSIKVPVEISGITGSSVLFLTGFLVWSGHWDIIRSPFFSLGLAVLMASTVLLKFYMMNREQKSMTGQE